MNSSTNIKVYEDNVTLDYLMQLSFKYASNYGHADLTISIHPEDYKQLIMESCNRSVIQNGIRFNAPSGTITVVPDPTCGGLVRKVREAFEADLNALLK